jgi:membrane protease YdiL (CAAX protease family)
VAVPAPAQSRFRGVLILVGVFAPALTALLLTARTRGVAGIRSLLRRILQWQVAARWYVFAVTYIVFIKLSVALVCRLVTGAWPRFGTTPLYIIPFAILLSTPFQSGEEIGWRGYALPRLAARFGLASASVLLGVVWALWHLPLFFLAEADTYHQSFFVYLLQITALSVTLAWLWQRTGGSLLLTMLMHAAVNNGKDIVPSATPGGTRTFGLVASLPAWLTVAMLCLFAAYLLFQMRRTKSQQLKPTVEAAL